jgi:small neutral amino acid transporter SnatA (MarC family)
VNTLPDIWHGIDRAMVIIALALPMVLGSRKQQEESKEKDFVALQEDTSWQTKAAVPFGLPLLGGRSLAYLFTATNQFRGTEAAIVMSVGSLVFVRIMRISLKYALPLSHRLDNRGSQVIARISGFALLAIG